MEQITIEKARGAKKAALDVFSKLGSVVGVGLTKNESGYAIKVNLAEPLSGAKAAPTHIDGVSIEVTVVGEITKQEP